MRVLRPILDVYKPALAYSIAKERGWYTSGIACTKAEKYDCFDVDERIVNDEWLNWGDESETFLGNINVLVRIGGGKQPLREATSFSERGGATYEYELAAIPS